MLASLRWNWSLSCFIERDKKPKNLNCLHLFLLKNLVNFCLHFNWKQIKVVNDDVFGVYFLIVNFLMYQKYFNVDLVFLFVLEFIVSLEIFSLIWRCHGCKFWPMLGTHGHWAGSVLQRATPTVTRGIRL